jgi:O-glycosyl hydrolase
MEVGAWDHFPRTRPHETELMYNPDTGLGLNILRIMIMPWNTDINLTMEQLISRDRPDYYENVKIVNKYGGYVLASPWSPPKEWKTNNSIHGSGRLLPRYYQQYANYLRAFAMNMYQNGAPIYAISIQNEPNYEADYDGCLWSPAEMRDFFLQVGRFTEGVKGFGAGREIPSVLTMNGESMNNPNINDAALNNPQSRAVIDLIGRHIYGSGRQTRYLLAIEHPTDPKEVWMTENNINSGNPEGFPNDSTWNYVWKLLNDIDMCIRLNDENAYIWWAAKRFYSFIGDGHWDTEEGVILPRGYAISHYAKFAKEKYRVAVTAEGTTGNGDRIGTRNFNNFVENIDSLTAKTTAFVSPDGNTISIVMFTPTLTDGTNGVDLGKIKIQLPEGFIIREAAAMRSIENSYAQWEDVQIGEDRNSAFVRMPPGNILSISFTR